MSKEVITNTKNSNKRNTNNISAKVKKEIKQAISNISKISNEEIGVAKKKEKILFTDKLI